MSVKECPLCAGQASIFEESDGMLFGVSCTKCNCRVGGHHPYYTKELAIEAWNSRSGLEGLDINDRIYFVLWVNLQLYQDDMVNMPQVYKDLIHNAVSEIGLEKFNDYLVKAVKKIDTSFIESINQHTLKHFPVIV